MSCWGNRLDVKFPEFGSFGLVALEDDVVVVVVDGDVLGCKQNVAL